MILRQLPYTLLAITALTACSAETSGDQSDEVLTNPLLVRDNYGNCTLNSVDAQGRRFSQNPRCNTAPVASNYKSENYKYIVGSWRRKRDIQQDGSHKYCTPVEAMIIDDNGSWRHNGEEGTWALRGNRLELNMGGDGIEIEVLQLNRSTAIFRFAGEKHYNWIKASTKDCGVSQEPLAPEKPEFDLQRDWEIETEPNIFVGGSWYGDRDIYMLNKWVRYVDRCEVYSDDYSCREKERLIPTIAEICREKEGDAPRPAGDPCVDTRYGPLT